MAATTASVVYSTQVTHIGSGASIAASGFSGSADVSVALVGTGNLARYPRADVSLFVAPTASIALASNAVVLLRRDLNHDGTNDEGVPNASNESQHYMGAFICGATTTASTSHYIQLTDVPLPGGDCEFYIKNTLGVNIPAGWTLKITPKSDAAA
jgi:hypothetical protein